MTRPCMATMRGGALIDLARPEPGDVNFGAIVWHLAHMARYNGAAGAYSVAQHSCHVADAAHARAGSPRDALAGLLHDGHEALVSDLTHPAMTRLCDIDPGFWRTWRALVEPLDAAIHRAAGLPWPLPETTAQLVTDLDGRALAAEMARFFPSMPRPPATPLAIDATWGPERARVEFEERLDRWRGELGGAL